MTLKLGCPQALHCLRAGKKSKNKEMRWKTKKDAEAYKENSNGKWVWGFPEKKREMKDGKGKHEA